MQAAFVILSVHLKGIPVSIKQIVVRTLALGAIAASATMVANAETLDFTLTGPGTDITFTLSSTPAVGSNYVPNYGFELDKVSLDVNGTHISSDLSFYTTAEGGGFEADTTKGVGLFDLVGLQLFSGSVKNPIFSPGDFTLTPFSSTPQGFAYCNGDDKTKYNLSIVDPSAVTPEPSSVLLLATGMLTLVGVGLSKRFAA